MGSHILDALNVRVEGQGDKFLVFAHGFGTDQSAWQRILPFFTPYYRVILFDLVCAGSVNPDYFNFRRYTNLEAYVDDLLNILDTLGVDRCFYVGHSVSAMIGILASIRRPELFTKLIMIGASPRFSLKPAGFTKLASLPSRAYVTFLAGDGDYVKGVVGLAKGLRKVKTAYPLIVAVLPDVPEEHRQILESQGCIVREIEPVYPPENQTQFAMAYYVINYSKLRIWEFVEYSKMIYLDGDIQVYDNIDHLFDLPDGRFYAVMDCFCEKTWSHTPQSRIGYCQQCPDKVNWPAEMGQPPSPYFNAGMFVFEPSIATYHDLLKTLKVTPPTPFAEQDFLNMYFKDIYKPIPLVYNLVLAMLWRHPENVELDKVKVVHYCAAGSKPWRYTGKEENMQREDIKMLVKKWWDIYSDESLDSKKLVAADAEPVNLQPFIAALSEAGAVHYITAPSAA